MSRWKIILKAWPPTGAIFVILSFLVTAFWLWHASSGQADGNMDWLEPLAAFLAGAGAFTFAAILIFRRVDNARAETNTYGLARGLATGYYFNFIQPLVGAIFDPKHSLHTSVAKAGKHKIVGLVVGLPQSSEEFDPKQHAALLSNLNTGAGAAFKLIDLKVEIEERPRPVFIKVALSKTTKTAIIVDIPTTLTVINDFAKFFAQQELSDAPAADDSIVKARKEIVSASQTTQFHEVLAEFIDVVNKVGSMESRERSPASILHAVPLKRIRKRLDELADH